MFSLSKIKIQKLALIVLVTCSAWSACSEKHEDPIVPTPTDTEEPIDEPVDTISSDTFTYLALGDSYTIGQSVEAELRWPVQLSKRLGENGKFISELRIIAQTGWTTGNLLNAIASQNPKNYDLVSLLIGVNNQYQGLSFSQFQTEFDSLLNISQALANGEDRVFVVSIPDYGVTPYGAGNSQQIGQELDMYNNYMSQKCYAQNIPFINITDISRALGSSNGALAFDNLHPSGSQYGAWVEKILPVVIDLIGE